MKSLDWRLNNGMELTVHSVTPFARGKAKNAPIFPCGSSLAKDGATMMQRLRTEFPAFGRRQVLCAMFMCVAFGAEATSCNDPNSYNVPNSIVTVDIKDDSGRIERHWMVHRDAYCRAVKIEVLDTTGEMLAYMIYRYDDSGRNARTKLAETTVDTYAADGSLLFWELADGGRLDAAGNAIDDCAFLRYIGHADTSLRKIYEQRCHDTF